MTLPAPSIATAVSQDESLCAHRSRIALYIDDDETCVCRVCAWTGPPPRSTSKAAHRRARSIDRVAAAVKLLDPPAFFVSDDHERLASDVVIVVDPPPMRTMCPCCLSDMRPSSCDGLGQDAAMPAATTSGCLPWRDESEMPAGYTAAAGPPPPPLSTTAALGGPATATAVTAGSSGGDDKGTTASSFIESLVAPPLPLRALVSFRALSAAQQPTAAEVGETKAASARFGADRGPRQQCRRLPWVALEFSASLREWAPCCCRFHELPMTPHQQQEEEGGPSVAVVKVDAMAPFPSAADGGDGQVEGNSGAATRAQLHGPLGAVYAAVVQHRTAAHLRAALGPRGGGGNSSSAAWLSGWLGDLSQAPATTSGAAAGGAVGGANAGRRSANNTSGKKGPGQSAAADPTAAVKERVGDGKGVEAPAARLFPGFDGPNAEIRHVVLPVEAFDRDWLAAVAAVEATPATADEEAAAAMAAPPTPLAAVTSRDDAAADAVVDLLHDLRRLVLHNPRSPCRDDGDHNNAEAVAVDAAGVERRASLSSPPASARRVESIDAVAAATTSHREPKKRPAAVSARRETTTPARRHHHRRAARAAVVPASSPAEAARRALRAGLLRHAARWLEGDSSAAPPAAPAAPSRRGGAPADYAHEMSYYGVSSEAAAADDDSRISTAAAALDDTTNVPAALADSDQRAPSPAPNKKGDPPARAVLKKQPPPKAAAAAVVNQQQQQPRAQRRR